MTAPIENNSIEHRIRKQINNEEKKIERLNAELETSERILTTLNEMLNPSPQPKKRDW